MSSVDVEFAPEFARFSFFALALAPQRLHQRASHLFLVQRPAPVQIPVFEPRVGVFGERGSGWILRSVRLCGGARLPPGYEFGAGIKSEEWLRQVLRNLDARCWG